ncbi:MAG TPA: HAMP domain-containing sensor histidine kinase [Actinomycetota bacterium]|jgi:signal transduction histidine kinase
MEGEPPPGRTAAERRSLAARIPPGTMRVRTTAAAAAVVAGALVLVAVAMVLYLRRSIAAAVETSAVHQAEAIADSLAARDSRGPASDIMVGDREEELVQVLDGAGNVVASSRNVAGRPVVSRLAPGGARRIRHLPPPLGDEEFLAVAVAVPASASSASGDPRIVLVGRTLEQVSDSTRAVLVSLGIGIPLLLLVVGMVTWRVVGRALAPVEAMRREVESISTAQLHRRVPEGPGNDEIARLAATMNRMLHRLEDGQMRQRQFVSDASHELRSPIATMRQHAEVAQLHPEATSVEELAAVVLEEDVRLQRLVEDLLLLTRADEGTLSTRAEPVDLDDVVFEEAARLRAATSLTVDVGQVSHGRVSGDRGQLGRLVRNLVDNAARHACSTVAFSLRQTDGAVVLTVDDDGRGIPPSERQRVFERFVRLDEARDRDSGGSGLGLAIVAEIAAAHATTVSLRDAPLGGTRAEVRFPAGA